MAKILSEELKYWRAKRPSEWKMDEFIRKAQDLEQQVKTECPECKQNEKSGMNFCAFCGRILWKDE